MEVEKAGNRTPEAMAKDESEGVFPAVVDPRARLNETSPTCLGDVLCDVESVLWDVFYPLARPASTVTWRTWRTPNQMPFD